jgi:hypothetical protein
MAAEPRVEDDFVDVRVVDLDLRRTTWSRVHDTMRVVFLRLNRAPPDLEWTRLFNEERESRINLRRCGLWLEDEFIGFDCLLHEVEAHHLPDIQRSIDYANRRYREVLLQRDRARREWSDESQAEASVLRSLRARLQAAAAGSEAKPAQTAKPVVVETPPPVALAPAVPADLLPIEIPVPQPDATTVEAPSFDQELELRRQSLRDRYRAALTAKTKETPRGDH